MLKKIFNYQNIENKSCLTILGMTVKWDNKAQILQELLEDIRKQNSSVQEILIDVQDKIKTSVGDIPSKENIDGINSEIKSLKKEFHELLDAAKNEIKNNNSIDFVYKNFDNPYYKFLYGDMYKRFTVGEYYSMDNIYIKRIDKYTISKNIEKIKEKYPQNICLLTDLEEDIDFCNVISVNEIADIEDRNNTIFILAYNQDYNAISAIKELQKYDLKYLSLEQYGTPQARYYHINEVAYKTLLEEAQNAPLTHFCPGDFENIFQAIEITRGLDGDYVEIGTFQGASARAALNYLKKSNVSRKCYFIDTYEGFTYQEAQNSEDMLWKNTHTDTSMDRVHEYLANYDNFELIKSNITEDELPQKIENISVANIDVDLYDAVKSALYRVKDKIVKNGIIIAEDYGHTPALIGAQKAVGEFLEEYPDEFLPIYLHSGQMFLIKK